MLFLLNRILPFFLPVVYFISFFIYSSFIDIWYLVFFVVVFLDLLYFISLFVKVNDLRLVSSFLYSFIFLSVGLFYFLLISGELLVNFFVIFWCLAYLIYLESIFHFYYQTKKSFFIDLVSISSYLNLLVVFLVVASFLNIFIFLEFSWGLIVVLSFIIFFILVFSNLLLYNFELKMVSYYSLGLAVIMSEIVIGMMFLPISLYVSALIVSVYYYLLNSLSVLSMRKKLNKVNIFQYVFFSLLILIIILSTTRWI